MTNHYNDIPASDLYNVSVCMMDGQRSHLWAVTINEAYAAAPIGSALSFEPILWKWSLDDGSIVLDLVLESFAGTLAIGPLSKIEAFERSIEQMTVQQLINAEYAH